MKEMNKLFKINYNKFKNYKIWVNPFKILSINNLQL